MNQRLKALKALFAWACEEKPEFAPGNPTWGVRKIKYATDGHHSWTAEWRLWSNIANKITAQQNWGGAASRSIYCSTRGAVEKMRSD